MKEALGPLLEGQLDDAQVQDLCATVVRAFKGLGQDSDGKDGAGEEKEDFVVKCDGIILAYAGKSLLRASSLRLVRGRRYGLVGQNGVGKSTVRVFVIRGTLSGCVGSCMLWVCASLHTCIHSVPPCVNTHLQACTVVERPFFHMHVHTRTHTQEPSHTCIHAHTQFSSVKLARSLHTELLTDDLALCSKG